jgi:hypothetical protein
MLFCAPWPVPVICDSQGTVIAEAMGDSQQMSVTRAVFIAKLSLASPTGPLGVAVKRGDRDRGAVIDFSRLWSHLGSDQPRDVDETDSGARGRRS